jgi:hypothetical protein
MAQGSKTCLNCGHDLAPPPTVRERRRARTGTSTGIKGSWIVIAAIGVIFCIGVIYAVQSVIGLVGDKSGNPRPGGHVRVDENRLIWRVAPTLEYDRIYYCNQCQAFGTADHGGYLLNPATGETAEEWSGDHSRSFYTLLFDEEKDYFGFFRSSEEGTEFRMWPGEEYAAHYVGYALRQYAYQMIDSDKVKASVNAITTQLTHDLSEAYISEKYALVYGLAFVTDFIYDDFRYHWTVDGTVERSAVKLNDKWGVVDKNGNTTIPFYFDDLHFIDEETAFAQLYGRYGILDVNQTSAL